MELTTIVQEKANKAKGAFEKISLLNVIDGLKETEQKISELKTIKNAKTTKFSWSKSNLWAIVLLFFEILMTYGISEEMKDILLEIMDEIDV